jgi:ribosomal protein L7/L12
MSIKITEAKNGFIIEIAGEIYILQSLSDLWSIEVERYTVREIGTTELNVYGNNYGPANLLSVRSLVCSGKKIEAIKLLRNIYTFRLGLKEAKELVELIGGEL